MGVKEDIVSNFECFNIFAPEEVVSKCVDLCSKYNMTGEEMVDQWFAYTSSMLGGAAPTLNYLAEMERKELAKISDTRKKPSSYEEPKITRISPQRTTFTANVSGTPKLQKYLTLPTQAKTPSQTPTKKVVPEPLIDVSSTPSTPSQTYAKRTDALTVRCNFGPSNANYKRTSDISIKIRLCSDNCLKYEKLLMYDVLRVKRFHVSDMIEDLFRSIKQKHPTIGEDEGESYGDNVMLYGRVVSETEGKINSHSILLEQTARFNGRTVSLNVNNLKKYSLFPGQVVVVKSTCLYGSRGNNRKDTFLVRELYIDGKLDFPLERPLITVSNGKSTSSNFKITSSKKPNDRRE